MENTRQKQNNMASYLEEIKKLVAQLEWFEITQVPREENTEADFLAKLAWGMDNKKPKQIPIERLDEPSIAKRLAIIAIKR